MKRLLIILFLLLLIGSIGAAFYVRHELLVRNPAPEGLIVEIPHGLGALEITQFLGDKRVIQNRYAALAYIFYTGRRHKLQAGEYLFDHPMTIPEVVDKLANGLVYLRKFTVPEGMTVQLTAQKWQEQGFGTEADFIKAATASGDLVRHIDAEAKSVEGYLFPETYSFPAHTTAHQAVAAMVSRFQQMISRVQQSVPADKWPLNLHDTVILASLVESEAAQADERPLVASVYLNRLNRHILLQCDPTIIYALSLADRYRGTLTLADLQFKSPYNTYVNAGLPPGPIANPGYASLLAAVQPASTNYLFFVRTVEARHTFSETLAAHNRAVAAYRKLIQQARDKSKRPG